MGSLNIAPPAIELRDVRFRWRSGDALLDVPHFSVARGERVFLHGPNGCGKSTLLGLIGGVLEPRSGAVRLMDHDLGAMTRRGRDRFRAAHLGFVFQLFNLVPYLSVLDNVLLPLRFSAERRRRAGGPRQEALRLLGALGLGDPGLLARPATQLSVGQQQRVAAARALIGQPDVLIADEPTSALDSAAREAFLDLLLRECAARGAALLFVSHDRSLGTIFDRSVSLSNLNRAAPAEAAQ
jgi:putative ABC transport system ATP-binding protein